MEPEEYLIWLYLKVEHNFKKVIGDNLTAAPCDEGKKYRHAYAATPQYERDTAKVICKIYHE